MIGPIDHGPKLGRPQPPQPPEIKLPEIKEVPLPELVERAKFNKADKNDDGVLTRDEFVKGKTLGQRIDKLAEFKRYDENGDGKLTFEEVQAGRHEDTRREIKGFFDRIKDGVGKLFEALGERIKEQPPVIDREPKIWK